MNENAWQIVQIAMWLVGLQTTIIIAVFGAMWASFNRKFDSIDKRFDSMDKRFSDRCDVLEKKIDKLDEKIIDIDKRVFGVERILHMQECCMLKSDQQLKKAE